MAADLSAVGVGFDDPIAVLGHELDHSPAIAWLKDLDGRYVYVNRRYAAALRVLPERLVGRRDGELTRREVIDGAPFAAGGAADEPLQLEYTVGRFDGRPALTVLRFVVRDDAGEPIGICGLASPVTQAHVARSECARLMRAQDLSGLPSRAQGDPVRPSGPQWSAHAQRELTSGAGRSKRLAHGTAGRDSRTRSAAAGGTSSPSGCPTTTSRYCAA